MEEGDTPMAQISKSYSATKFRYPALRSICQVRIACSVAPLHRKQLDL